MSVLPYLVAAWVFLVGCHGLATSRNLTAPVFSDLKPGSPVVDPVVQALALTTWSWAPR